MYDKIAREMFLMGFICVTADDVEEYLRDGKINHLTSEERDVIEELLDVFL